MPACRNKARARNLTETGALVSAGGGAVRAGAARFLGTCLKLRARAILLCIVVFWGLAIGPAQAQLQAPALRVNGNPLVTSRPVTQVGKEWHLPLVPIARALGMEVSAAADGQGLRVRRADGVEITYDARTGEIRQRFVLVGQVPNYHQVQIVPRLDEILFPLSGVAALLGVSVQEDTDRNLLVIEPLAAATASLGTGPRESAFHLASLQYNYGLFLNGPNYGQQAQLRGEGLLGGTQLTGDLLLSRLPGRSFLGFRQGSVSALFSGGRRLTLGDQPTFLGVDALLTTVRGVGYERKLGGFDASLYGGRGVGSTLLSAQGLSFARYDTNLAGIGFRRRSKNREFSFGGNIFGGPERSGSTAGVAYSLRQARNEFRAQGLAGWFSGLSSRSILVRSDAAALPLGGAAANAQAEHASPLGGLSVLDGQGQPILLTEQYQRARVRGGALGVSVADTFNPFKQLSVTGQWERYGKNFLTTREDARFNGISNSAVSVALRPIQYVGFTAGASNREFLLGKSDRVRNYNYGASGSAPHFPLQVAYFRSIQLDPASPFQRFSFEQYSVTTTRIKRYTAFLSYSNIQLGREMTLRTASATIMAEYGRYGRFSFHDQLQLGTNQRVGGEWYLPLRKEQSFLRFGIDRFTSRGLAPRLMPVVGLRVPLPRGQSFQLTYLGDRDTHMLQFELGGPLVRHRELARNTLGVPTVVVQTPLLGRVYFDSDVNNDFTPDRDKPVADVRVWLDDKPAFTNAQGMFRFEQVAPGAHRLRAELAGIPAGFVFSGPAERTIAVVPYRVNSQDFRIIQTARVMGRVVYMDYHSNGGDGPVERPFADAHIVAGNDLDSFSESNGSFLIGDMPPGTYQLRVDTATIPAGYVVQPSLLTVEAKPGQTLSDVLFHLVVPPKPIIEKALPPQEVQFSGPAPAPGSPSSQRR